MRPHILSALALTGCALMISSCEDELSQIGSTMRPSDVTISVDSAAYDLKGVTIPAPEIEANSATSLLGSILSKYYGTLSCSYLTQFLPAENVNIPDSITPQDLDSVRMIMRMPTSSIVGDSLTPQQVSVFRLTEAFPELIPSDYNADAICSPTPMGKRNYTLSTFTMGDEGSATNKLISLRVPITVELGREMLRQYREDPSIFLWPQKFAEKFPGIYVKSSFGNGCIASVTNTGVYVYSHHIESKSVAAEDGTTSVQDVVVKDSTCFLTSAPEVRSSTLLKYNASSELKQLITEGNNIITTPGGYTVKLTFPTVTLLKEYWNDTPDLGVINGLSFNIPAEKVIDDQNIDVPPTLLMVHTSEVDKFFEEGMIPDKKTSFIGTWSEDDGCYKFDNLRAYIDDMRAKGEANVTEEDMDFTLIPVLLSSENVTQSDGSTAVYYTGCQPYIEKPTMVRLHTDRSIIVFTYSNQTLL